MKGLSKFMALPEITAAVKRYFGKASYELTDISQVGSRIFVKVTYEDFKPVNCVRHDIENIAQNVTVYAIERTFSKSAMMRALEDAYEPDGTLFVKMSDGSYHETSVALVLEESMNNIEL